MRRAYIDLQRNNPELITPPHFHHCLMVLRQDLMCLADDTPMPSIPAHHHIGEGQVCQCRDWDSLVAWTQESGRDACYHMLDDYHTVTHTLEEFAYCRPGLRYRETMEGYFATHGHKDPYSE
jgi:Mycotoxin biosynthesis protein UstYa